MSEEEQEHLKSLLPLERDKKMTHFLKQILFRSAWTEGGEIELKPRIKPNP